MVNRHDRSPRRSQPTRGIHKGEVRRRRSRELLRVVKRKSMPDQLRTEMVPRERGYPGETRGRGATQHYLLYLILL